jgi:hypothetical protein
VEFATSSSTTTNSNQVFQLVPMGDPSAQQFSLRAYARAPTASCNSWVSATGCVGGTNLVDLAASVADTNLQVWRVWRA